MEMTRRGDTLNCERKSQLRALRREITGRHTVNHATGEIRNKWVVTVGPWCCSFAWLDKRRYSTSGAVAGEEPSRHERRQEVEKRWKQEGLRLQEEAKRRYRKIWNGIPGA